MFKEFKMWLLYSKYSFLNSFTSQGSFLFFLVGKIVRIGLFVLFLHFLFNGNARLANYSREQIITFYLVFNFLDTLIQFLFREVYRFKDLVRMGNFDGFLLKPFNPLVRVLLGGADVIDLIMLIILGIILYLYVQSNFVLSLMTWGIFIYLCFFSVLIAASFNILVLSLGIRYTAADNLILFYRDLTSLARIPINVYNVPIRTILTYILPVGIMLSYPAEALTGIFEPQNIFISTLAGTLFIFISLKFWRESVKLYQSASS